MHSPRSMAVILLGLAAVLLATPSRAGSPAPYPLLGKIQHVHLSVSSDLAFDPIPGLDRQELLTQIEERSEEVLRSAGFELTEAAEAYASATVDHAWYGDDRKLVALLISVELDVLAEPVDIADRKYMHGRPTMSLWQRQILELAPSSSAAESILVTLDTALEELVEARRSAQAGLEDNREW